MTISISDQLKLDLSQLQQDALLDLFEIDMRHLKNNLGEKGDIYRFYSGKNALKNDLVWQGKRLYTLSENIMVNVKFYGKLKQFGTAFELDVKDTAEAIRALCSQIKGLRQQLQQGYYKVRIGKDYLTPEALEQGLFYRLTKGQTLHCTPVIRGAKRGGVFNIVLGVVMIAAAFFTGGSSIALWGASASMMGTMGVAMVLSGVAQMLTKTPTLDTNKREEQEKKSSTAFSNLNNIVAQGKPVPLAYSQNDQGDTNPTDVTLRISVGNIKKP